MNPLPPDNPEPFVLSQVQFVPVDRKDSPGLWKQFLEFVRTRIGLKPSHLVELHFHAEKVKEQTSVATRLMEGQLEFEKIKAEVEKTKAESEQVKSQTEIQKAQAQTAQAEAQLKQIRARREETKQQILEEAVRRHQERANKSPAELAEELQSLIQILKFQYDGDVEFDTADPLWLAEPSSEEGPKACSPPCDVFISYNRQDQDFARRLAHGFKDHQVMAWYDEESLEPGELWLETLEQVITGTKMAVIVFGPHGLGRWQKKEVRALVDESAKREKLRLIPVQLPGAKESDLPAFLRQSHVLAVHDEVAEQEISSLCLAVKRLVG